MKQPDDMISLVLLLFGNMLFTTSGLYLNCTNDYGHLMSCHFDAENCMEHNMTLHNNDQFVTCAFGPCVRGCCCSMQMSLVLSDKFTADVFKGGQSVHSQTIGITETIKPQTPTIVSTEASNGLYQFKWKSNTKRSLREGLGAIVTYKKKGDTKESWEKISANTMEDMNYYQILGSNLETSTTYVISVKTYTYYDVFSDSSKEVEFKTDSSQNGVFIAVILGLSVTAVIVTGVIFTSFIKLKGKFWDRVTKDETPKFLDIQPKKAEILMPESLSVYSLSVEPLVPKDALTLSEESLADSSGRSGQTSGISTGFSFDSYANAEPIHSGECEAFKKWMLFAVPVQSLGPTGPKDSSGVVPLDVNKITPVEFMNETYSSTNILNQDIPETPMVFGNHSSEGPLLQDLITSPSVIETDMSYHPCTGGDFGDMDILPVVYGYQAFETLVEQPNKSEDEDFRMKLALTKDTNNADVCLMCSVPNEISVDYGYHCV